ncbi:MAG: GntR family transcriptional regulator [Desulfobacteraceae bacterium]|nr:GntR family transcriptional regulator [Desulfobacteraceae bacterium]
MLNPDSPIPLYHQLAEIVTDRIKSGAYRPGENIPSEIAMAKQYGIGRPTVRQAMDVLVQKKLIQRRRGAGSFVMPPPPSVDLFSLGGTSRAFLTHGIDIQKISLRPVSLVPVTKQPDNPFNESSAFFLSRVIKAEGTPVLKEDIFLDPELFRNLDRMDVSTQSLSKLVADRYHLVPENGTQTFTVAVPDPATAQLLDLLPNTPVLRVFRELNFPRAPKAVYAVLHCRTDHFAFSQTIGSPA